MKAAKKDLSGVFRSVSMPVRGQRNEPKTALVSASGLTFSSAKYVAPFTEVRLRLQNPRSGSIKCNGVVVECQGDRIRRGFRVAVAFLNVPQQVRNELRHAAEPITSQLILGPSARMERDTEMK